MTTSYIDLKDRDRNLVQQRARVARLSLGTALDRLRKAGYEQTRFDQWRNPKTGVMVETGYCYGETRLTVHSPAVDGGESVTDFRLVGGDQQSVRMHNFLNLTGCSLGA